MKYRNIRLRRLVAVLMGIFFLSTGLLKLMDPVGTMLIVTEYLKFFHLQFLLPAAKVIGICFSFLECALGVALITGIARKVSAWVTYGLLAFFTLITFILWRMNPEMDCGCFGEAFHLTHLQSFLKNVVLLLLAVFAFTPLHNLGSPRPRRMVAAWLGWAALVVALIFCNRHIPLLDFTAYKPGSVLFAAQEGASPNEYHSAFIYEKDGHQRSFTLENLPDTTWTFVKVDTLYRETPHTETPILSFRDADGNYQDDVAVQGKVVVFSVYDPAKAPWEKIRERYQAVQAAGVRPLLLVMATPEEMAAQDLPMYFADYKTLITMNRDNGGATYLDKGEVIAKWGVRDFPRHVGEDLAADPVDLSTRVSVKRRIQAQGFCLILGAMLILL